MNCLVKTDLNSHQFMQAGFALVKVSQYWQRTIKAAFVLVNVLNVSHEKNRALVSQFHGTNMSLTHWCLHDMLKVLMRP